MYSTKIVLMWFIICASLRVAALNMALTLKPNETVKNFFNISKHGNILVTSQEIYLVSQNNYKAIPFPYKGFADAYYMNDTLFILRSDTIFFIPKNEDFKKSAKKVSLKQLDFEVPLFNRIVVDKRRIIWVSSDFGGVYSLSLTMDSMFLRLMTPVINDINTTADSCFYVATNIGLYKYIPNQNAWIKYNEEALSGYEMPDNIMEKIMVDNASNIWVLMPDNISFLKFGEYHEVHIPSFQYLGDKETRLLSVNTYKMGYILATTKGILYLKEIHHDESENEVHRTKNETALLLPNNELKTPKINQDQQIIYIGKNKKSTYLFTKKGYWVIKD